MHEHGWLYDVSRLEAGAHAIEAAQLALALALTPTYAIIAPSKAAFS